MRLNIWLRFIFSQRLSITSPPIIMCHLLMYCLLMEVPLYVLSSNVRNNPIIECQYMDCYHICVRSTYVIIPFWIYIHHQISISCTVCHREVCHLYFTFISNLSMEMQIVALSILVFPVVLYVWNAIFFYWTWKKYFSLLFPCLLSKYFARVLFLVWSEHFSKKFCFGTLVVESRKPINFMAEKVFLCMENLGAERLGVWSFSLKIYCKLRFLFRFFSTAKHF